MTIKPESKNHNIKEIPKEQKQMKNFSENSKLARNNLHFKESESTRVQGFSKALDHKRQVKRDYQQAQNNNKDTE